MIQIVGMTYEKSEERFGNPRLWFSYLYKTVLTSHQWDAEEYSNHSSIQKDAASHLLKSILWKGSERVLDVGCGDGKITAAIADFIPRGNVTGIDISAEMVHFAQQRFPKDMHHNLGFIKQDAQLIDFDQEIDVIFSSFALQWLPDLDSFFKRANKSLSRSGRLAVTVPLGISSALEKSITAIISLPKYSPYFISFPLKFCFLSDLEYKKLLEQNQFTINQFNIVQQEKTFASRACFESYVYQWFVYFQMIPLNLRSIFFKQIIDEYLKIEPLRDGGGVMFNFSRLDFIALKNHRARIRNSPQRCDL
jgi:trans-aconitate methyltransferase